MAAALAGCLISRRSRPREVYERAAREKRLEEDQKLFHGLKKPEASAQSSSSKNRKASFKVENYFLLSSIRQPKFIKAATSIDTDAIFLGARCWKWLER